MLTISSCDSLEEKKNKHIEEGKEYYMEKDYISALDEFSQAIRIDADSIEARFWKGATYEKLSNSNAAIANFKRVLQADGNHIQANIHLGSLYIRKNRLDDVIEIADRILSVDANNADAYWLKSAAYLQRNEIEISIRESKSALEIEPGHLGSIITLAKAYISLSRLKEAIKLLKDSISSNPENIELLTLLSQAYISDQQSDKAINVFTKLIFIDPESISFRKQLSKYYEWMGQSENAEETLLEAVEDNIDNIEFKLLLADYIANKKDKRQAEKDLQIYIQSEGNPDELRFRLARFYEDTLEQEKARKVYMDIVSSYSDYPNKLKAKTRLSVSLFREKKYIKAEKLVNEILEENPNYREALLLRGKISLLKRDPQGAIIDLRALQRYSLDASKAFHFLAKAHLINGEYDLARINLQKAIEADPESIQPRIDLARLFVQINKNNQAIKQFEEAHKMAPDNISILKDMLALLVKEKDWSAISQLAKKARIANQGHPFEYYLRGIVYKEKNKYNDAIIAFEKSLNSRPDDVETLTALAMTYVEQGKSAEAIERVNKLISHIPDNIDAYALFERLHHYQKDDRNIEKKLLNIIKLNNKAPESYRNLGYHLIAKGDMNGAINIFKQGTEAVPNDLALKLMLASAFQRANMNDKAIHVYEKILSDSPGLNIAINNLAVILANSAGDHDSQHKALKLVERFLTSENPVYLDTSGWVHYRLGNLSKATAFFEEAVSRRPGNPEFRYHLGLVRYRSGNFTAAKQHLGLAVGTDDDFPGKNKAKQILNKI